MAQLFRCSGITTSKPIEIGQITYADGHSASLSLTAEKKGYYVAVALGYSSDCTRTTTGTIKASKDVSDRSYTKYKTSIIYCNVGDTITIGYTNASGSNQYGMACIFHVKNAKNVSYYANNTTPTYDGTITQSYTLNGDVNAILLPFANGGSRSSSISSSTYLKYSHTASGAFKIGIYEHTSKDASASVNLSAYGTNAGSGNYIILTAE